MSMKKGLGRSFESLIPKDLLDESFDPSAADDQKVSDLRNIKLSEIVADSDQPRRNFDEKSLQELTESIKLHGVLQPIVVVAHKGKYQIVAGERRFRASQAAGKTAIPALVRTLSAQHKLELSLIENIQRRDLNPLETATAYGKLRDQFNLTLEEIGKQVGGKSVSAISNKMRLLRLLPEVKKLVVSGELTEGQARPLVGADDAVVKRLLPKIIKEEWSARKIEHLLAEAKPAHHLDKHKTGRHVAESKLLSQRFETKVVITSSQRGAGKIEISFASDEERKRLEDKLSS